VSELDLATYVALPDERKRQLCVELLAEFGVSEFAETKKGELRHQCTLPLGGHTDRNSVTASINYKKLLFNCWVCHNSGSILWWAAVNRHESSTATRDWLKDASGFTSGIPLPDLLEIVNSLFHPKTEERIWPNYDPRVLTPWTWSMHHPYLTLPWTQAGREIPIETLTKFQIGYCDHDDDWGYDQRIIIPVFWEGNLVAWQARGLSPDDPGPKYIFSPDPPRDRILYCDPAVLTGTWVVLVESTMSVLRHDHHLPMAATMGADITDLQLALLHRFERVYLALDNDKAGWTALAGRRNKYGKNTSVGLIERLRPYTEVFVVQHCYGAIEGREGAPDPSDFTDAEFARQVLDEAVPGALWRPPDPGRLSVYRREENSNGHPQVRGGHDPGQLDDGAAGGR
jgi:hypothetical protein